MNLTLIGRETKERLEVGSNFKGFNLEYSVEKTEGGVEWLHTFLFL